MIGAVASDAEAAVRYAAPAGSGPSPCLEADPCSLFTAVSNDAGKGHAEFGDEVIVESGEYSGMDGELGPHEQIEVPVGVKVRGDPVDPPVLWMIGTHAFLGIEKEDIVSGLRIDAEYAVRPLNINLGTAEEMTVEDWGEEGVACRLAVKAILRDSACLSHGWHGVAMEMPGVDAYPGFYDLQTFRNVTAIADGTGSVGLRLDVSEGEVFARAISTISEGTAFDIEAIATKASAVASVQIEHSAYDTTNEVQLNGGTAFVTEAGTHGNITEPPLLAEDQVHELPGSPTIDKGVIDEFSGEHDVDGDARVAGASPDIGADEMPTPTTTTVACDPTSVVYAEVGSCVATVTTSDSRPLTGTIELVDETGFNEPPTTCQVVFEGAGRASCSAPYRARAINSSMALVGRYSGDPGHAKSYGESEVELGDVPTATAISCNASALVLGQSMTCTATVTNTAPSEITPSDRLTFWTTKGGVNPAAERCELTEAGPGRAVCETTFTATDAGIHGEGRSSGMYAEYLGDDTHLGSRSSTVPLQVSVAQSATLVPGTTIKRKPPARTRQRRATFAFTSNAPSTHFKCRVDRSPFRACRSPDKVKVAPGRHVFEVKAVDATGADPTPAKYRWTVLGGPARSRSGDARRTLRW